MEEQEPQREERINLVNRIHRGDCVEVMGDLLQPLIGCVDVVFADPPYNLSQKAKKRKVGTWKSHQADWDSMDDGEYRRFTGEWVHRVSVLCRPSAALFACASFHNLAEVMEQMKIYGFAIKNVITWQKTNPMQSVTKRCFTHASEFVVFGVKEDKTGESKHNFNYDALYKWSNRQMTDVWTLPQTPPSERVKLDNDSKIAAHPSQKPREIVRRCLLAASFSGKAPPRSLVLDPFLGTGTTAVVAIEMGMLWIGIEREKEYIKIAQKRISNTIPPLAPVAQ